jgi:hypothetical protein
MPIFYCFILSGFLVLFGLLIMYRIWLLFNAKFLQNWFEISFGQFLFELKISTLFEGNFVFKSGKIW